MLYTSFKIHSSIKRFFLLQCSERDEAEHIIIPLAILEHNGSFVVLGSSFQQNLTMIFVTFVLLKLFSTSSIVMY